jgi:hypothetical protein
LFSFVLVDAMVDAHSRDIASRKYLFLFIRTTDRRFACATIGHDDWSFGLLSGHVNYSIKMTIQSHRARMVSSIYKVTGGF